MRKEQLRQIVADQKNISNTYSYAAKREEYAGVLEHMPHDQVLVISGVRRCGKSTLLHYVRSKQAEQDYFINFDDERLSRFSVEDFQTLFEVFIELYGNQTYFYFDEIQNILGWERFVRRLHDNNNKVFITGSNASMLSKELGTHLTGRHHQIELYPFSFREYLDFFDVELTQLDTTRGKGEALKRFRDYLTDGGFPGFLAYRQADYLKDLYQSILYRDIVTRYGITRVNELKEMVYFIASNVGSLVSYGKIKQMLQIGNTTTIKDYFYYLQEAYLAFTIQKFHYSAKRQLLAPKKIYFIDSAMAQMVGFRFSDNVGHMLENLVYLELRRRYAEIFYHSNQHECDFIIRDRGRIEYAYQVTQSLADAKTKQREITGLVEAMAEHDLSNGMILTLDESDHITITEGDSSYSIDIMPIWRWLLPNTH